MNGNPRRDYFLFIPALFIPAERRPTPITSRRNSQGERPAFRSGKRRTRPRRGSEPRVPPIPRARQAPRGPVRPVAPRWKSRRSGHFVVLPFQPRSKHASGVGTSGTRNGNAAPGMRFRPGGMAARNASRPGRSVAANRQAAERLTPSGESALPRVQNGAPPWYPQVCSVAFPE